MVGTALDELLGLLDLEELEVNVFRGRSPQEDRQRVFGGQVAGQALVAAGRTVEFGAVHSLHAYFLRPGDPTIPILYDVDRIRDGRSFTTRRVVAIQHGRAIFHLSASFQKQEEGLEHQVEMPDVPDPETLETWAERGLEMAAIDPIDPVHPEKREPEQRLWIRTSGALPDDLLLHQCIVCYASDMTLIDTALLPHAISWADGRLISASLDHAMWFHRSFRADDWLLYAQESPAASGARGFTVGRLYTRAGGLVASVAQEGLIRLAEKR